MGLDFGQEAVTFSLKDNGVGFDPQQTGRSGRSSWGLLGMRERASLLGGDFQLESAPGRGTLVRVTIPYQNHSNEGEAEKRDEDPVAAGG